MAEVYRAQYMGHAHSVGPQNEVVVKRIKPSLFKAAEFPIFREMFLNEAKLVRSLQHPNLARMHMLNEAVDKAMGVKVPFIVGEYIKGQQLWELMRIATRGFTGRGVPPAIAAYIVREMARGLGHAHAHKDATTGKAQPIIHRDISPENIMVSTDGHIKVIDFGVAKAIGGFGPQTQTGIIKGKLAYMAPEQVAQKVVPATDVFGAGIVLWEMLTGRRLFGASNDYIVINKVLKAEIPPPSVTTRGIPKELEEVLMTALARDLSIRYVSGNAFADALTDLMSRVTFLRGISSNSVKRWAEQTQAEGAKIASGWAEEASDEDMRSSAEVAISEAAIEAEIELTGDDLMQSLDGQLDPGIKAVVNEGRRNLKPELLNRKQRTASSPQPGQAPSTASSRRTPPPPPPRSSRSRQSAESTRSQQGESAPGERISAPELRAPPAQALIPASKVQPQTPGVTQSSSEVKPVVPSAQTRADSQELDGSSEEQLSLRSMLADPQMVRWIGIISGLAIIVVLLLLVLLFLRC